VGATPGEGVEWRGDGEMSEGVGRAGGGVRRDVLGF
jgi:hypothetical protein